MVGIGGGMPLKVRLGDIVVSAPVYGYPGVVQWDLGIAQQNNDFRRIGALDRPPGVLRSAITKLEARHELSSSETGILSILKEIRSKRPDVSSKYLQSEDLEDVLFQADYNHVSQRSQNADNREVGEGNGDDDDDDGEGEEEENGVSNCQYCDRKRVVKRKPRKTKVKIHYGLIASGNSVIKNASRRDEINEQLRGNVLCFGIEVAGITVSHPCLVIRGISGKIQFYFALAIAIMLIIMARLLGFAQELQLAEICCYCSCCFCEGTSESRYAKSSRGHGTGSQSAERT